ncbi:hypothetical protein BAOM_4260 [Peribacillus asahii]|uniref:TcaA protein NTF2-like domain-containing protein n=1 Tax=Peribacillus asahii TaxID=228899 RepID=A0A3Q9RR75_9BACI|nr:hypothetical protein [Peribacillus asahii]AZV44841.1 hypothetical protein BAOM_4260 [Peribacillus asahii]
MSRLDREKDRDEKRRWRWGSIYVPLIGILLTTGVSVFAVVYKSDVESKAKEPQIEETKDETVTTAETKSAIKTETEESFDIILKGLEDYRAKYVEAYNKNNMSYIKEFYSDEKSDFYNETKDHIIKSYYENRKIENLEMILKNNKRKGSNTYDAVVDLVYIYDVNGDKEKETVTNRHYIIDITEDSKIILSASPLDARGNSIIEKLE